MSAHPAPVEGRDLRRPSCLRGCIWGATRGFGKVFGMRNDDPREARPSTGSGRALMVSVSNHAAFAGFAFLLAVAPAAQQQALSPPTDPAAVERGQRLHVQECGFCHGANARGGSGGPDLTRSALVQNDENGKQLGEFLQVGRPDRRHAEIRSDARAERRPRGVPARGDLPELEPPPLQDPRHPRRRSQGGGGVLHRRRAVAAPVTRPRAISKGSARSTNRSRCRGGCSCRAAARTCRAPRPCRCMRSRPRSA